MENKFFVKIQGGSPHEPVEKITFLTHVPKIITKDDAVNLVENIFVLLDAKQKADVVAFVKPPAAVVPIKATPAPAPAK